MCFYEKSTLISKNFGEVSERFREREDQIVDGE
jgi:hypothetical protein